MRGALLAVPLLVACAARDDTFGGRAEIVRWDREARVISFCDTGLRYQLGIFTSNAEGSGASEVEQWLSEKPGPLVVELVGFPSSLPSGWPPVADVAGVLSVGYVHPIAHATCSASG